MLPVAVLAVLAAGCGTERAGSDAAGAGASPSAAAVPGAAADFPCPGESPLPAPRSTSGSSAPQGAPPDHYAENHGFKVPLPLHGQKRCEGLAAAGHVKGALEPLRGRGDFAPEDTRRALVALGYPAEKVRSYQNGTTGVGFLVDAASLCLEGTMSSVSIRAEAFGGYPDGTGCEPPRGGH
ncbi:hypothetical protein GCM10010315_28440 [Streptomyces luteosporeus]|uniref:PASTA domain-containing protein n=1 Tax=Streptomyces luteosporeus TaxID=173856 RepID=A0ABP6G9E4_9ACTN